MMFVSFSWLVRMLFVVCTSAVREVFCELCVSWCVRLCLSAVTKYGHTTRHFLTNLITVPLPGKVKE